MISNAKEQEQFLRIRCCLPEVDEQMVFAFAESNQVSLTMIRLWAEQGILKVVSNESCVVCEIVKDDPPTMTMHQVTDLLKQLPLEVKTSETSPS